MKISEGCVVWWLKKDFRLSDNPALTHALELAEKNHRSVLPVFVIEPSALNAPETSGFHVAAWLDAAKALNIALKSYGGELLIVNEEVIEAFEKLRGLVDLKGVVSHQETGTNRTFERDKKFAKWCKGYGIKWDQPLQTGVFRRLTDRDKRSQLWHRWMSEGPIPLPSKQKLRRISAPAEVKKSLAVKGRLNVSKFGFELSAASKRMRQRVTESDAQDTLDSFLNKRGLAYSGGISSPNTAFVAGSRLSAHLAWGTITGRQVYAATNDQMEALKVSDDPDAGKWRRSLNSFKARLHWRDHFTQRLETEPSMEFHPLNRAYDALETSCDPKRLNSWMTGRTGFPMVDAVIRCAQTTGFANFRMRSMITSVGCHAMRLDYRDMLWPMAKWWADYEPGIHVAQLQMQAGVVGINTLRTYNPAKQISDHDPKVKFVKRWVPELRPFTAGQIIAHQDSPIRGSIKAGYVKPIVNWRESSTEMRADYYLIRRQPETKELAAKVLERHGSRKKPSSRKKSTPKKKRSPHRRTANVK